MARRLYLLSPILLMVSLLCAPVTVQAQTALLHGRVEDPSGAPLSAVRIAVENLETTLVRSTQTDRRGNYRVLWLNPGEYVVRAAHPGFEAKTVRGVKLAVGESAGLDLVLELEVLEQQITVTADARIVEREKVDQTSNVTPIEFASLPSDGRSYLDFTMLRPGVSDGHTLVTKRPVQAPTMGLSFAGQDQRSGRVLIDGLDNMDDISNSVRSTLSQEAVREFQINTANFPASLGRARSGIVNIVSKSGGNQFHGSAFFHFRDEKLDARNTFAKRYEGERPRFARRQYGGSFGGPMVPGRTFFFASHEGLRREESLFVTFLDDSGIFEPTGSQRALFDFLASQGDDQLQQLAALFNHPEQGLLYTGPSTFPKTYELFERESGVFPFDAASEMFSLRVDHLFTTSNQAFGRFSFGDSDSDNTSFGALEGVSNGVSFEVRDWTVVFGDLHVFSPSALNDFRFQWAGRQLAVNTNDPLGPEVVIAGVAEFGREFLNPTRYDVDLFQVQNQATLIRGRHTLLWGADLEWRERRGDAEVFLGGRFAFGEAIPLAAVIDQVYGPGAGQDLAVRLAAPPSAGGLGNPALAAHLLEPITSLQSYNFGLPLTYLQGFGDPSTDIPVKHLALFFQDSWKVFPTLTLNLGLRYQTSWRAPTLNVLSGEAPFAFALGAVNDHDNLAPRLGFAWAPGKGKTVVRGGYGLYHQNIYGALEVTSQVLSGSISQVFLPLTGLPGSSVTSAHVWNFMQTTGSGARQTLEHFGIIPGTTPSVILPGDGAIVTPYSQQAGLGVERTLGRDWALGVNYQLNKGSHLIRARDYNVRRTGPDLFEFPGLDPRFAQVPVMETSASSIYHGMTAALRKRFSGNFGLNVGYTLGKSIDDTTDFIVELGPHDHTDLASERSLSSFDQRHRLVVSGVVLLSGLNSRGRAARALLSGWSISPVLVWSSGKPFNLLNGFDRNGDTHEDSDRPLTAAGLRVGRNTGRGPGFVGADLRLARRLRVGREDTRLELIAEVFNLFNRANYSGVNNVVGNRALETAGVRGSQSIPPNRALGFTSAFDPRRLQLGLRFTF